MEKNTEDTDIKNNGFVKWAISSLGFSSLPLWSTTGKPRDTFFARLELGAFYNPVRYFTFHNANKINRTKIFIFIITFLILLQYPSLPYPSEMGTQHDQKLKWIIENIKDKEKGLKTFTANFVQKKETSLLSEPLHSEGLIYFDCTGSLLMKITSPSEFIILIKDNRLAIYYPSLSNVEERYLGPDFLKRYFGIGQSFEELEKQYNIRLVSEKSSNDYHLELIPKTNGMAKYIEVIDVIVNGLQWLPKQISFKEARGDRTILSLLFTSVNKPLPPDIFDIDLPDDIENSMH